MQTLVDACALLQAQSQAGCHLEVILAGAWPHHTQHTGMGVMQHGSDVFWWTFGAAFEKAKGQP